MSIDNQDFELKKALGYRDKKTRVYIGGREVLHGVDWKQRVQELQERCGGRCEYTDHRQWGWSGGYRQRCTKNADDPHHEELRSKLRDDRLKKLRALCRGHHILVDQQQREAIRARNREKYTFRIVGSTVDGGQG